jgi:uridine phosphorylase
MSEHPIASELILNADGSVYHINLHPHDIANTVITVGDPSRVEMVSKYFDAIEYKGAKREFITHTGRIGKKRLSVISTGIGTDNIDIVLNELDQLVNVDLTNRVRKTNHTTLTLIRLGTSGSICPDLETGSLVLSSGAIGIDNLLHFYQFENTAEELDVLREFHLQCSFPTTIQPYYFSASNTLINNFGSAYIHGITLTSPGFYGPQGRQIHASLKIPDLLTKIRQFRYQNRRVTNIEMESAAIYGLSSILKHEALSINVLLANRATGQFSENPMRDVDRMIETSLEVISKMD